MALDPAWRKTPAGIKLGKFLFDAKYRQALQNNPTMIVGLMRAAGIPIPKEIQVTAATAQLIVAGGAFASNIETSASINSIAKSGAGTIQAAIALATITGLAEASDPIVQDLKFGADVALAIASGGTNVLADISVVLDVTSMVEITKMQAQQKAYGKMNAWMRARRAPQVKALKNNFKKYQEGDLDIFSLMGEVAEESPDFFQTYFPDLKGFIPTLTFTHTERASKGGMFGTKRSSVSQTIQTIVNDHKTVSQGIVLKYGGLPLSMFKVIQEEGYSNLEIHGFKDSFEANKSLHSNPLSRISIIDMMALSMMPPYISVLSPDFDISNYLAMLELTPHDLGYSVLDEASNNPDYFPNEISMELKSPIQFYPSQDSQQSQIVDIQNTQERKMLKVLDERGDILNLLRDKKAKAIIKEWGTIPRFFNNQDIITSLRSSKVNMTPELINVLGLNSKNNVFLNLDVQQFWAGLSYLESFKKAAFFRMSDLTPFDLGYMKNLIEKKHKKLMYLTVSRQLNKMAKENVADFLEVPINKLRRLSDDNNGLAMYHAV